MSDRLLYLYRQDEPTSSHLARFAARIAFIEEQLNGAEADLAAASDHDAAAMDLGIQGVFDALESLEKQLVWRAWEVGEVDFRAEDPPGST